MGLGGKWGSAKWGRYVFAFPGACILDKLHALCVGSADAHARALALMTTASADADAVGGRWKDDRHSVSAQTTAASGAYRVESDLLTAATSPAPARPLPPTPTRGPPVATAAQVTSPPSKPLPTTPTSTKPVNVTADDCGLDDANESTQQNDDHAPPASSGSVCALAVVAEDACLADDANTAPSEQADVSHKPQSDLAAEEAVGDYAARASAQSIVGAEVAAAATEEAEVAHITHRSKSRRQRVIEEQIELLRQQTVAAIQAKVRTQQATDNVQQTRRRPNSIPSTQRHTEFPIRAVPRA